jgi:hypothetical protein
VTSPGTALDPVIHSLLDLARRRSEAVVEAARADAARLDAEARSRAEEMVASARRQGIAEARKAAAARVGAAHRRARQLELEACGRAYEEVRRQAIDALERQADTAAGRRLRKELVTRAMAVLDACREQGAPGQCPPPVVHAMGMAVAVESGRRRVAIGPADLVDVTLESMGTELSELWT